MLRKLTAAPRSRAELAAVLAERGIPDEVAEAALDRFVDVGLINDAAYAELLVSSRSVGRGRRALSEDLRHRGVPDEVAIVALSELSPEAERAVALTFVRRRLRSSSSLDPQVRTRRLVGQLTRRGFAPGLAFAVVREVVGESPADLDGTVDGD
jgi:regulatory protein